MAVPTVMSDLSTTIASNSPAGSDSPTQGDDNIRALMGIVRREASAGSDLASASTITPDALSSSCNLSGTTTVTAIASTNSWDGRCYRFRHTGAHSFTHSSTLNCPGGLSITFASGDISVWRQRTSGTWDCISVMFAGVFIWSNAGALVAQFNATTNAAVGTNASATTAYSAFIARQAGANKAFFGVDGGQGLVSASTNSDALIRVESGSIWFAIGATAQWRIDGSGRILNTADTQVTVDATLSAARTTTGVFTTYTENVDFGSTFNNGTGVFTAPVAGLYQVTYAASLSIGTNSDGYANFGIRKNGSGVSGSQATCKIATNTLQATVGMTRLLDLAASDTLDLELLAINGTAASTAVNSLTIRLLG